VLADPGRFDICRRALDHVALVTASCVRRTACCQVEAEVLFEALADCGVRFDIAASPSAG